MRVIPRVFSYLTGSLCTIRCSCISSTSMSYSMRFETSSFRILCSLIVLTYRVDIFTAILQLISFLLLQAPYSGLSLPYGFKGKTSCDCCKSMSAPGDVSFVGTLTLVLYTFAIIDLRMITILQAHVLQYGSIRVFLPYSEPRQFPRPWGQTFPAGIRPELRPSLRGGVGWAASRVAIMDKWADGIATCTYSWDRLNEGRIKTKGKPCKGSTQVWNESGKKEN